MAASAGLLGPIVRAMLKRVLQSEVVQTDDTPVKVQDHDGKGIKTGRLWVHIGDHNHRYTVYDYTPDRSGAGPGRVFKDFTGYLQADAYSAYDALFQGGTIVEVGCWMHARRKFYEARTSDPARSHLMLAWVAGLYEVEEDAKEARKKHPEWDDAAWHAHRYDLRLQRSRPILDAIHAWLVAEQPKVLPKSPIGEAIGYALNHWGALIRPLEAGFLEIDNGASERARKPVALGRNYAGLKVMRSRGQDHQAVLANACSSTPHNPFRGCRGIRAAYPSLGRSPAWATGLLPSSAPPPSSADRPPRTGVSSRGFRGRATTR